MASPPAPHATFHLTLIGFFWRSFMMQAFENPFRRTCHQIGLSGTNGVYEEDQGQDAYTNVDRTAVQWLKFPVNTNDGPVSFYGCGRLYDDSPTNAFYYYFSSLLVNCAGDMVAGFSGSNASNSIGAYYTWRPAGTSTAVTPRLLQQGDDYFSYNRWGDYSYPSLDPTDNLTLWTVQQYAADPGAGWRTWIARIRRDP